MIANKDFIKTKLYDTHKWNDTVSVCSAYFNTEENVFILDAQCGKTPDVYCIAQTCLTGWEECVFKCIQMSKCTTGYLIAYTDDLTMLTSIFDAIGVRTHKFYSSGRVKKVEIDLTQIIIIESERTIMLLDDFRLYHKRKLDEWKRVGYVSFTAAATVRHRVKKSFENSRWTHDKIARTCPATYNDYCMYRKMLYRGGYCFAEAGVYANVDMYDIQSAHIYHMLTEGYPSGTWRECDTPQLGDLERLTSAGYAVIAYMEFAELKANSIAVESKGIRCGRCLHDKQRHVEYAESIKVVINEIDWDIYNNAYTWKSVNLRKLLYTNKNKLPAFIRNVILEMYDAKRVAKMRGGDYSEQKRLVNMIYGGCATRISCANEDEYTELLSRIYMNPLWSMWTAAYTRRQQYDLMHTAQSTYGANVVYGDTDSVYTILNDRLRHKVDAINREIEYRNERLGVPRELGTWELKHARVMKVLGAKQYAYVTRENELIIKAAGVRRSALNNVSLCDFRVGLTIQGARRHIESINGFPQYVYDDLTLGDALKFEEIKYITERVLKK